jgi:hypothetical protein
MTWVLVGGALLVIGVFLEGRRQARLYGRPSGRPQGDRHVETLVRQAKGDEVVDAEQDESGDGANAGAVKRGPDVRVRGNRTAG